MWLSGSVGGSVKCRTAAPLLTDGVMWVELVALYSILGGEGYATPPAQTTLSLAAMLRQFKQAARVIAKRCMTRDDAKCFLPCIEASIVRARLMGLQGRSAAIALALHVEAKEADRIATALLVGGLRQRGTLNLKFLGGGGNGTSSTWPHDNKP